MLRLVRASPICTRKEHAVGKTIGHFTVVGLVSLPLSEREAEGDIVLIQTSFLF